MSGNLGSAKQIHALCRKEGSDAGGGFMEEYYLVLSRDIGLSPTAFVTAWNEEEKCRAVAIARDAPPSSRQYDFNLFADILLVLVTNIATSALYDLIKHVLARSGVPRKNIHIETVEKPDGTRFSVLDIKNK